MGLNERGLELPIHARFLEDRPASVRQVRIGGIIRAYHITLAGTLSLNITRVISSDLIPQCSAYQTCFQIIVILTAVEDASSLFLVTSQITCQINQSLPSIAATPVWY
jgi:hypothetical protein